MKIILIAWFCLTMFSTMTCVTESTKNICSQGTHEQQTTFDLFPVIFTIHCITHTILIYREIALSTMPMLIIANP
jgi:hypothetical protein